MGALEGTCNLARDARGGVCGIDARAGNPAAAGQPVRIPAGDCGQRIEVGLVPVQQGAAGHQSAPGRSPAEASTGRGSGATTDRRRAEKCTEACTDRFCRRAGSAGNRAAGIAECAGAEDAGNQAAGQGVCAAGHREAGIGEGRAAAGCAKDRRADAERGSFARALEDCDAVRAAAEAGSGEADRGGARARNTDDCRRRQTERAAAGLCAEAAAAPFHRAARETNGRETDRGGNAAGGRAERRRAPGERPEPGGCGTETGGQAGAAASGFQSGAIFRGAGSPAGRSELGQRRERTQRADLFVSGAEGTKPDLIAQTFAAPTSSTTLREAMRTAAPGTTGRAATPPPQPTRAPPAGAIQVSGAPDRRFNGRETYMMAIQMPNLTSYSGSWLMWYADRSRPEAARSTTPVAPPVAWRKVDPKYVASAVTDRIQGKVRLACVIGTDGHVSTIELVSGLDDRLNQSAEEALAKWEFTPATRHGEPVEVDVLVEDSFQARAAYTGFVLMQAPVS